MLSDLYSIKYGIEKSQGNAKKSGDELELIVTESKVILCYLHL